MSSGPTSTNARLQAAQGYLGLGMVMEAWSELDEIDPQDRAAPSVLSVRLEVARALGKWETVEVLAQHLAKIEPDNPLHVADLAQAARQLHGPETAARIYAGAVETWPDVAHLRLAMAVELCACGRVDEAKTAVKSAIKIDKQLRAVAIDHPGLAAIW